VSRRLTRRERAVGKTKRAPPQPKPAGAHKAKRLPWTDAEVAAMREEARVARERLAATCEVEGHVLRYRTPWESVCDRCGHVERRAVSSVERSRRSRANTLAMVAVALAADLGPPERAARKGERS